jgi:hypothetical protein
MIRKTPLENSPLANFKTAVRRCVQLRDKRDAALKAAAASLSQLEAMVDSATVTDAEVDAAEVEFEQKVGALVELDRTLSTACDGALTETHLTVLKVVNAKNMAKA